MRERDRERERKTERERERGPYYICTGLTIGIVLWFYFSQYCFDICYGTGKKKIVRDLAVKKKG